MQQLDIKEMRSAMSKLDQLLIESHELIIMRNKKAIARVLPVEQAKKRPSHSELRQLSRDFSVSAEALIRQDRDER
jgi:hypothetical protein